MKSCSGVAVVKKRWLMESLSLLFGKQESPLRIEAGFLNNRAFIK
jgi:hypothetical protein